MLINKYVGPTLSELMELSSYKRKHLIYCVKYDSLILCETRIKETSLPCELYFHFVYVGVNMTGVASANIPLRVVDFLFYFLFVSSLKVLNL